MPPPAPWITRATISSGSVLTRAAISVPAERITYVQSSSRSFPNMSPSRPRTGVATEAESRYAVSTQAMPVSLAFRLFWRSGRAGMTADCRSA